MVAVSGALTARYRWSVISRVIAAVFGGYVLTSLLSITLSLLLSLVGVNKAEAVLAMSMASFLMFAFIVMAVFHARTAMRAWIGLAMFSIPLGLLYVLYAGRME